MRFLGRLLVLLFVVGIKCDFELTILHTNDVHARFEEFSEVGIFSSHFQIRIPVPNGF